MNETSPVDHRPPAILLAGPTASGKTALAFHLVDEFSGHRPIELVSVDSAQVFIDMNIGTAKPDDNTLARYPHHLINLVPPDATYSAGQFLTDARRVMDEITARGHVPLLVGGTMLYYKVLLTGISDLPVADASLRQAIEEEAAIKGWPAMHAELARHDPQAAARIDPNHAQRIQRALELVRLTGETLDTLYANKGAAPPDYRFLSLALFPQDRTRLHRDIEQRFRTMVENGLVDEVRALREKYALHHDLPSMRCVGYRQAWSFIEGSIDHETMINQGVIATRQLAKRQATWLRSLPFEYFEPHFPALYPTIRRILHNFLETQ